MADGDHPNLTTARHENGVYELSHAKRHEF